MAVANAKKLIESDKLVGIVGPESTSFEAGIRPIVEEAKIVNISCQGGLDLTKEQRGCRNTLTTTSYP